MNLDSTSQWLAVYTKPRTEKKVEERLIKNGIEAYCPTYITLRVWSDRKKKVELPLIPSYVFVKVEEQKRGNVLQDPGVLNFVFWQGKPALIRQIEIDSLKSELANYEGDEAKEGDSIIIEQGVFKGLEGTIVNKDKNLTSIYLTSLGMVLKIKK